MIASVDSHLMRVVETLVMRVGLRNVLLALAATCNARAIQAAGDEPHLVAKWEAVGAGLERFARTRLNGLR
jgi:hypothetical protein